MRTLSDRLAARLAELRTERGWSLEDLAARSGLSRSTLSRVERGEISPTATQLGKLCTVYERPMSRLLTEVEADGPQLIRAAEQGLWTDADSGYVRRSVSPPHPAMRGEVVEGTLRPGADISCDAPSVPGLEQHLWLLEGALEVTVDGRAHALAPGDCLRFRLWGPTRFRATGSDPAAAARYLLVLVMP